ncbi:hypothetical protein QJS66_01190 [Kocuria rhizophila]|nr:hypothetical protein QJS66_01190 [Kocuria rhizophila]
MRWRCLACPRPDRAGGALHHQPGEPGSAHRPGRGHHGAGAASR